MLRKAVIEKKVSDIQKLANELGLEISEVKVTNKKVITELEKVGKRFLGLRQKPNFISKKNYRNARLLPENVYGVLFGIRFIKEEE